MDEEEIKRQEKKFREEIELYGSPLRGALFQLHEIYEELKQAGFSRREAMYLVSHLLNGIVIGGAEEEKK